MIYEITVSTRTEVNYNYYGIEEFPLRHVDKLIELQKYKSNDISRF